MVEKNPWWKNVSGPFPKWEGPVGCKDDGGGCHYGRGKVGKMIIHRAVHNKDKQAIMGAIEAGNDVNEVEAAGNTPLHSAAYEGWLEGAELLIGLSAKVNASNNAGDRPWHWAQNMGHEDMMALLVKNGSETTMGKVIVSDHIPKVKDFFGKECWAHHPKPYAEFMEWRKKEDERWDMERGRLVPGM
ncbi:ankyrin [Coccomyxa subellipsoidea C-169]|uniref:Ankyrin n=1 Tax=Coccomyxa subellipsoidea (strain C-169) TaxID=574566 RepID=I0YNU8_COCSC|nr:ankyrin [Coccomyxa subellipsoidea C-169]EIE20067.1 ankyrin [Coccomyxa subellipsoidea C-169]|eukprot:XP_005644611.1 ankyrin [Coccomyxa subellipsoidea C-169]